MEFSKTIAPFLLFFIAHMHIVIVVPSTMEFIRGENEMKMMHNSWMTANGKKYDSLDEKNLRYAIFKDNLKFIDEHNESENGRSYNIGLNRFADLTNMEYQKMYVGTRVAVSRGRKADDRYLYNVSDDELPTIVDWREKGAVSGIKDQGTCGVCVYLFIYLFND